MTIEASERAALARISTGTITTILFKRGMRSTWLRGPTHRFGSSARVVGEAFTMRFIAGRDDLASPQAWSSPRSTRACVEAMPAGCVVVADARGSSDAGIVGDILCARMQARGVRGLVVDGAVRDAAGMRALDFDIWALGVSAPPAVAALHFAGWEEPISCGGVAVMPGDVIVADEDGAVVVPRGLVGEVLAAGAEQEALEAWILEEVRGGKPLAGLYPLDDENRRRYERLAGGAQAGGAQARGSAR